MDMKIMFDDRYGLTQAVVDLIKTNTRRAEKSLDVLPLDYNPLLTEFQFEYSDGLIVVRRLFRGTHVQTYHLKPRYKIGDVVAVAQSYKAMGYDPMFCPLGHEYGLGNEAGWSNKMFVSADLCKHHIKITEVRFERLQDISDEDCMKEGIMYDPKGVAKYGFRIRDGKSKWYRTPKDAFSSLIDKVSGKGTWERNPYVYVYSFTLID